MNFKWNSGAKWNTDLPSSHQRQSKLEPEMKFLKGKLHGSLETLSRGKINKTLITPMRTENNSCDEPHTHTHSISMVQPRSLLLQITKSAVGFPACLWGLTVNHTSRYDINITIKSYTHKHMTPQSLYVHKNGLSWGTVHKQSHNTWLWRTYITKLYGHQYWQDRRHHDQQMLNGKKNLRRYTN